MESPIQSMTLVIPCDKLTPPLTVVHDGGPEGVLLVLVGPVVEGRALDGPEAGGIFGASLQREQYTGIRIKY